MFADVIKIKDLEMERLPWITWLGVKCNHVYLPRSEAERIFRSHTEEEGEYDTEAETAVM